MTFLLSKYILFFYFFFISFCLGVVIWLASFFFSSINSYSEKLSPYECGFDPFEDARSEFDIRFYIVAMLFIVFDIEASFVFPWAISLGQMSSFSFWVIIDFLFELFIGFAYVWKVGALEWE